MPADNSLYDRPGDLWWDPAQPLHFLHTGLGPARIAYFTRVLTSRGILGAGRPTAVDVGCGGGLLAEPMAAAGLNVLGVDPSLPSLRSARVHALRTGAAASYASGIGESLPLADASMDVAFCCDVLEHVTSIDAVLAEIARVLRPGGVFCFDTVNRTLLARLVVVGLMQEFAPLRVVPAGVHDHRQFVRPAELVRSLTRAGLATGELVGFSPGGGRARTPALVRSLRAAATGAIDQVELGRRLRISAGRDLSTSYGGYAIRCRAAMP